MEQKKILWIFSILIAFLLIVFAIAWYFYSPSRKKNNTTVTNLDETQTTLPALAKVDADAWAKNNENVPKPNEDNPPTVQIENSVTVVTGNPENGIDVNSLVDNNKTVEGTLPASLSNTVIANVSNTEPDTQKTDSAQQENATAHTASSGAHAAKSGATTTASETKKTKTEDTGSAASVNSNTTKKTTNKKTSSQKPALKSNKAKMTELYWVQTASLSSRLYAEEARKQLQEKNFNAEIFTKETLQGLTHRVRVGPFENKTEASYWLARIKKIEGFEDSFVSEEKIN